MVSSFFIPPAWPFGGSDVVVPVAAVAVPMRYRCGALGAECVVCFVGYSSGPTPPPAISLLFRDLWSGWCGPPLAQDLPCGGPLPGGALPSAPFPLSRRITCAPGGALRCEPAKSLVKDHLGRMTCDRARTKTAQQHQPDHPQSSCHACKEDECTTQGECDHLSDIPATRNDEEKNRATKNMRSMHSCERIEEMMCELEGKRWDAVLLNETYTSQTHIHGCRTYDNTRSWNYAEQEMATKNHRY